MYNGHEDEDLPPERVLGNILGNTLGNILNLPPRKLLILNL